MSGAGPRPLRFAVIGAGMAGILSAIKLKEAGFDFAVFEKAERVGGTWRENTYPGLSCDVPSHLYSYSFALNPDWSRTFSPGPEIQSYFERVAADHDVLRCVRFGDEVTSCELDHGRWEVTTASGHRDSFDVVIAATGVLHHPRYPDIEGLDSFKGAMFHSSRWDHGVKLDGTRVGVIGTGSTAIQITAGIAGKVKRFDLFQRTAQWIMRVENPAYSEEQIEAWRAEPHLLAELHQNLATMFDGFSGAVVDADSSQMKAIEDACKANLEDHVAAPDLRERLRPDYRAGCKRLIISADFYDAIQRPGTNLVTEKIERVEPGGVRTTDGALHELDLLVLATGFKVDAFMRPMTIVGEQGRTLEEAWTPRPEAYLSISIPGFPNFFMLNGPNGPVGNFSLIEVAELELGYIMQLVSHLRAGECDRICASTTALELFEEARVAASAKTVWATGCRSWYLDDRGVPAVWPWPFSDFRAEMAAPKLDAYQLS